MNGSGLPTEELFSAICGPPIAKTTSSVTHDVGIYSHELYPTHSIRGLVKKSSTPPNCLAISETHIFAAQHEKAQVQLYSRLKGQQEPPVHFEQRIRSLALQDDVLLLGTEEGGLLLWEICTGRRVSVAPRHVQPVTCIASTAHHVLTGSEDSTVNVWSLPSLLELDSSAAADGAGEHEPTLSLSHHRAAVVALSIGPGTNRDTRVAVSASRDKTCVVWNYQTGDTLRTLLFPTPPLCICLDACLRALFVSCEEGSDEAGGSGAMYAVELFSSARPPLLGPRAAEDPGTVVQIPRASAFAVPPPDAGPASCLALTADGLSLVSGHTRGQMFLWSAVDGDEPPVLLADLSASVANVVFCSPPARARGTKVSAMVRPSRGDGANYNFTARLEGNLGPETRFTRMLGCTGIPAEELEKASVAFQEPATAESEGEAALRAQLEELWALYNEQRALQQTTQQLYLNAKKGR